MRYGQIAKALKTRKEGSKLESFHQLCNALLDSLQQKATAEAATLTEELNLSGNPSLLAKVLRSVENIIE